MRPRSQKEQMRAGGWFWVLRREGKSMKAGGNQGMWSKVMVCWGGAACRDADSAGAQRAPEGTAWDCGASRGEWRGWEESGNLRIGLGGGW